LDPRKRRGRNSDEFLDTFSLLQLELNGWLMFLIPSFGSENINSLKAESVIEQFGQIIRHRVQEMDLILGGLHEKHEIATLNLGTFSGFV
jgi:hypothetical protein